MLMIHFFELLQVQFYVEIVETSSYNLILSAGQILHEKIFSRKTAKINYIIFRSWDFRPASAEEDVARRKRSGRKIFTKLSDIVNKNNEKIIDWNILNFFLHPMYLYFCTSVNFHQQKCTMKFFLSLKKKHKNCILEHQLAAAVPRLCRPPHRPGMLNEWDLYSLSYYTYCVLCYLELQIRIWFWKTPGSSLSESRSDPKNLSLFKRIFSNRKK